MQISSGVLDGKQLCDYHKQFDFFSDVPESKLSRKKYEKSVNKYGVACGTSLAMWESKGWISPQDPYGWFLWYCHFWSGRRSDDDDRQVSRWRKCAAPTGRWRNNLITKIYKADAEFDDESVSPVVRQTLHHWAYELTEADYKAGAKKVEKRLSKK